VPLGTCFGFAFYFPPFVGGVAGSHGCICSSPVDPVTLPKTVELTSIPTAAWGSSHSVVSPTLETIGVSYFWKKKKSSHCGRRMEILHCGLICIPLKTNKVEILFNFLLAICLYSLLSACSGFFLNSKILNSRN
jgi:hypothetical protein